MEQVSGIGGVFFKADDAGVEVDEEVYPNGRFAQLHDPEGNPVQLWQPE